MDSSSNLPLRSRPRRQAILSPETLEGRQLLSTTAAATDTASTAAVSVTPPSTTTMSTTPFHFARGGHSAGFGMHRGGRNHRFAAATMRMTATMLPFESAATAPAPGNASITAMPAALSGAAMMTADPSSATAASAALANATAMPVDLSSATATTLPTGGPQAGLTGSAGGFGIRIARGFTPGGPMMGAGFAPGGGMAGGGFAQGGMAMGGPGAIDATGTTSTDPGAAAMEQYLADVQTIADKSQVTPALQAALRKDLQALNSAATTAPDQAKALALQSDVQTLAGTLPTGDGLATLRADFTAAVNSEGVTDSARITQTFSDLNALIAATNIGPGDVTTLTADLKAAGLSTAAPLGPGLGIDLGVLSLAINADAVITPTTPPPSGTSGSSSTSTTAATS